MENIITSIFENLSGENLGEEINQLFNNLLIEIHNFLNLEIINSNLKLLYKNEKYNIQLNRKNILDLGVKRFFQNNTLFIEILDKNDKFLPFILLREAYYCFIPNNLKENVGIKIIINQIIEINLQKFPFIKEWKILIRDYIVDYDYLSSEFDRLEKFLKLQGAETDENPIKLFFQYIRKNIVLIDSGTENFHEIILKEFILKTSKSMKSDEVIETLRVLIKIFYKVKSYRALLEYQNYFKEFINNGIIQTDLSLRKFSENLRWLNKFSYIAPSYHINFKTFNAELISCIIRFNPILSKAKIDLIIEKFPFFMGSRSSESYFAVEISGWFMIPSVYIKDLHYFIEKLEQYGYIIKKLLILHDNAGNFLNLNYFREFYRKGRIINPDHICYHRKYEIDFNSDLKTKIAQDISILEYVILNRVMFWSMSGFSFERRAETLRTLKSDLFHEILSRQTSIKRLIKNIEIFHEDKELKTSLLQFLRSNTKFGFFFIKERLQNLLFCMKLIKRILAKNSNLKNIYQIQEFVKKTIISTKINDNILLEDDDIKRSILQDTLPIYFKNKEEFNQKIKTYRTYLNLLESCFRLKIFDLKAIIKIIEDEIIKNKIYSIKQNKLKEILQNYRVQDITSQDIDDIFDSFLTSSVIKPLLINTINTTNFAKYFIEIIIKDNKNTVNILNRIKRLFPRVVNDSGVEFYTNERLRLVQLYLPNLNEGEKELLISFIFKLFSENIISLKRYFFDGFITPSELKDFYDISNKEFFYTSDLFEQYFIYINKILGNELKTIKEKKFNNHKIFWSTKKNFKNLIKQIDDRISREQIDFDVNKLSKLSNFHQNLEKLIVDYDKFKLLKTQDFFQKYVKTLKFKPTFQNFSIGQYYLYLRPIDLNEIDFKLLFQNTFRKVKYPAYIDDAPSLFIKFLFPYRNPNMAYINWLTKSKKIISEYCIFYIKRFYPILHFDYNLGSNGWELEANHFKAFLQKVLFEPGYGKELPIIKDFNIGELSNSKNYGQNSIEFNNLSEILSWKSIDLKSVLGTRNYSLIDKITSLIQNNLIVPYIKLKNLDFQDKIYIILPSLKKETIEVIIKVFSYFNYCFIYEIEGEFFIYENPDVIKFENGLLIKLYLPQTEISNFQKNFDLLFQFLKIKKYLILNDMVDGEQLIKNTYGSLKFLDTYNPLKNLIWNDKDKIWMNHKLFNEKFEPIYPDLIPKK